MLWYLDEPVPQVHDAASAQIDIHWLQLGAFSPLLQFEGRCCSSHGLTAQTAKQQSLTRTDDGLVRMEPLI